jgi:hypothetical protein
MNFGYCDNMNYDTGTHSGQDNAYYQLKDYDLVAIEANSDMIGSM